MKSFKSFIEEAYGPWGKKSPADLEKIRKALEREKRNTVPGQLRKPADSNAKKYKNDPATLKYFSKIGEDAGAAGGGAVASGPTNVVSSGSIAGSGGKGGEPGVYLKKKKAHNPVMMGMGSRKPPKI